MAHIDPHKILTVSSKRTFDTCPRKWFYQYRLNLAPKEVAEALIRGTEFHLGAEVSHAGGDTDKIDSAKKLAYDRWVKKHDDLRVGTSEVPMLVPLERLYDYSGRPFQEQARGWYYGGVLDALAVAKNGSTWVLDHKTVERFYPLPTLFSLEQLGLYVVAAEIFGLGQPSGGVISRVKQLEAHGEHILNHTLKAAGLEKKNLKEMMRYYNITNKSNIKSNKNLSNKELSIAGGSGLVKIKLRPSGLNLGVTEYNSNGSLVQSIQNMRGHLVHVKREYHVLNKETKQEIVRDFLRYAEEVIINSAGEAQEHEQLVRRSPGLHCNQCPFQTPCDAERMSSQKPGSCIDPEMFILKPPNEELMSRLPA